MSRGIINTGVSYYGEVKISLNTPKGKKEIYKHNDGQKPLWNLLAKAIAGYDVKDLLPKYLDIVDSTGTSLLFKRLLFTGVVWGDAVETSDDSTSALFYSTLMNEYKSRRVYNGSLTLQMLDSNGNVLASVKSDSELGDAYSSVTNGVNATIEWKMVFSNASRSSPQEIQLGGDL